MASMASSGAAAPKRIERIVASRKNAHGRTTRNTNKGATSLSQGEGASIGGPNNPPNTQPTSVVLELIEADKQSPNHPSQIGKALKQKGFSSFTEIEKLGKFRFRINTTDETRLRKLKLDGDNLRVYEPKNKDHTILFVRGVPLNFEEDEIIENIEVDCPVLQVQRIKRKGSNRDLVDTYNVKITVEGNQIPNSVKIYGCGFKAELYIFPIRQCQNCWRYGHGAKHCTSRTRCASCGGTHDQSVCEKDARCPNCKKPHKANDPTCPEMQRHKKIRLAMREKQIPFSQAESCFPRLTNRFDLLSEEMAGGSDSFPELPGSSQPASSYSPRRRRSSTPRHQDEPNRTTETPFSRPPRQRNPPTLAGDYEIITFDNLLPVEVVGIKITKGFDPISLISVYVPPNSEICRDAIAKIRELFDQISNLEGEILVGGDFNGHHSTWDPSSPHCPKGNVISAALQDSNLILLNDGSATCMTTSSYSSSAVDISLATAGLAVKTSWEVVPEEFGSNHLSIIMEVGSDIPVVKATTIRINNKKAAEAINRNKPQYLYDPAEMQNIFEDSIQEASFVVKDKKANYLKRWWSKEIDDAYNAKRALLREYNKSKTLTNLLGLQKGRAQLKRLIRKAKRTYCSELSEAIDETTPTKQLWNIIKGLDVALTHPVQRKPETTAKDAEEFMTHYYENKLKQTRAPTTETISDLKGYEKALSAEEILTSLKRRKKHSAAGEDGMSYDILKQLKPELQIKISEMLNEVFVTEKIPERWRTTLIKPIPKSKGNPQDPSSYRPIALMNVCLKLINSAVNARLNEIAEITNLHPLLSFGFRKNCSAQSCVTYVTNRVRNIQQNGGHAIVVFLDLTQAFDTVNLQKLLSCLQKLSIPNKLISWLHTYLSHRRLVLKTSEGDVYREVSEGLPQGCPLSPTLFNFYTNELHQIESEGCELVQFADDFAVVVEGKDPEDAADKVNTFLDLLSTGLNALELQINVSKSAAVAFTRKDTRNVSIKIGREKIALNNTHRYLGYIVDRTLTHRKHIDEMKRKASDKLKIIKLLGRRNSSANPSTLIKVGNSIIRSRLEYGSQIYGSAARSNLQKLQTVQNSYLRSSMRYLKSTPIHVILAETGQVPLDIRREWLTLKEILKGVFHNNQLKQFIDRAIQTNSGNGSYITETATKYNYIVAQLHPKDPSIPYVNRRQYSERNIQRLINQTLYEGQNPKAEHSQEFWRQKFLEVRNLDYSGFNHLYTDASKTSSGTAIAVYDSTDQQSTADKINPNFSITNAELLAIWTAIGMVQTKGYKKTVIFTDSRGACQTILNRSISGENYLAWKIRKTLKEDRTHLIALQWIPSHQGIQGNEKADTEAVKATQGPQTLFNSLTLSDAIRLAKSETDEDWTESYVKTSEEKGVWHFNLMKEPPGKIWYSGLELNTEEKIILGRIRTGHTNTKVRRYKWGIEITDSCDWCDEIEDLNHLLYDCPKYNVERSEFSVLEYYKPLNTMLLENNELDLKQIVSFLKATKIRI
nr:uncharacterized protein LOC115268731 [Aedes albopictus]